MDSRTASADDILINTLKQQSITFSIPSSPDYDSLRLPYNLRLQTKPAIIVIPKNEQQVCAAVSAAAESGFKVQARSGGHSYASFSTGGKDGSMVVDLRELHKVEVLDHWVNAETGEILTGVVAKVGAGTRLGNMARHIYEQRRRALPHGTGADVGIGGHATLGGYGYVSRAWGLALDRIIAVDVVLANGKLVHASAKENGDVFWAVRGAAHSIGVVVNFYMKTEAAPKDITYVEIKWDRMYEDKLLFTSTFLSIQDFAKNANVVDERLSFGIRVDGASYKVTGGFIGGEQEFKEKILPVLLRNVSTRSSSTIKSLEWMDFLTQCSDEGDLKVPASGTDVHESFFATSLTVPESDGLTRPAIEAFFDHITSPPLPEEYFIVINLHGGPRSAINQRDRDFSAYADRESLWTLQIRSDSDTPESKDFAMGLRETIMHAQKYTQFGASLSYIDAALGRQEAWKAYYGENQVVERLRGVKARLDPYEVFWNPHSITKQ